MASIPERRDGMLGTVQSLLPYCDNFDIVLNGYPLLNHPLLEDPKITAIYTQRYQDIGARGKFYLGRRTVGYHITVDDDIVYPADYVPRMIQGIEKYDRRAVVGMHGSLILTPNGRYLVTFEEAVIRDMPCHVLGTGVMGYHSSALNLNWDDLEPGKIDEQVALYCQANEIPMYLLAHPANWIRDNTRLSMSENALRRNLPLRRVAWTRIKQHQWRLFT
jgi:hypothetical protein